MKRRVLPKTTPFHVKKKKKKKRRPERCRFERHCSSFFLPWTCSRGRKKNGGFFFFKCAASLLTACLARKPREPHLASHARWPTTRRAPTRKTGSGTSTAAHKWPTNRRSPCSPCATIKSPAPWLYK